MTAIIDPPLLRVLIVEDEVDLRDAMIDYLHFDGCIASGVGSIAECAAWLENQDYEVIVLDIGLPDGDGLAALMPYIDRQRQAVVLATARGQIDDRVRGYECGGDAYLVKPVDLRELSSVIHRVASRLPAALNPPAPPPWILDTIGWRLVSPEGAAFSLTHLEMYLFKALAETPGQAAPRERIIRAMGHNPMTYDSRSLEILVRRLRRKASQTLGRELPLETVHGVGYAFLAEVSVLRR
ncbi:MAG: response regulator transcription factor [Candidatus Contendobacter sp.]|jgi:DNA-binding response OmpR family regulator|nr:response regulator transcription factor [Gammaproteobacteria bacterium]MCC8995003.1 response regulator transcription factor [Candidatus Contendobacter sp.]